MLTARRSSTRSSGWRLDADRSAGSAFRLIQFTPPGSATSVQLVVNLSSAAPGSAQALLLAVNDIEAAYRQFVANGIDPSEVFHCATGTACRFPGVGERVTGPQPQHFSYSSFVSFRDPDGNSRALQEIAQRLPGRVAGRHKAYVSEGPRSGDDSRCEGARAAEKSCLSRRR